MPCILCYWLYYIDLFGSFHSLDAKCSGSGHFVLFISLIIIIFSEEISIDILFLLVMRFVAKNELASLIILTEFP